MAPARYGIFYVVSLAKRVLEANQVSIALGNKTATLRKDFRTELLELGTIVRTVGEGGYLLRPYHTCELTDSAALHVSLPSTFIHAGIAIVYSRVCLFFFIIANPRSVRTCSTLVALTNISNRALSGKRYLCFSSHLTKIRFFGNSLVVQVR